ncbi:MAG: hypothetical protein R3B55_03045 [Candidatus Paceibacterota bacterium]
MKFDTLGTNSMCKCTLYSPPVWPMLPMASPCLTRFPALIPGPKNQDERRLSPRLRYLVGHTYPNHLPSWPKSQLLL